MERTEIIWRNVQIFVGMVDPEIDNCNFARVQRHSLSLGSRCQERVSQSPSLSPIDSVSHNSKANRHCLVTLTLTLEGLGTTNHVISPLVQSNLIRSKLRLRSPSPWPSHRTRTLAIT